MLEFLVGLLFGKLLCGPAQPPKPLPEGRTCAECLYYERMQRDDPHFAPQHWQARINHRLYGVCSERGRGFSMRV